VAVQRFIGRLTPSREDVKVIATPEGIAVGVVSLGPSDFSDGTYFELVCAVLSGQQRRGFAVVACREMLRAARAAGTPKVVGCVDRENEAGLRLLRQLGASFMCQRGGLHQEQDVYELG
jgi:hypothetical protein